MRTLVAVAALAVLVPAAARPEQFATTKDAEMMVHNAVAFLKKEGKAKALAEFSDPKGRFTYRDLYIMAYDLEGKCLAHGAKKERIGKSLIEERDVDGKQFVKERIQIAKQHGKGWQTYKFQNPVTKQIEPKVVYFERVGDVVVVCGAYQQPPK
jgi:signal transduction histidine kinase